MIIVRTSGGLGNQMYQYALYRKFQYMGIESKISLGYFDEEEKVSKAAKHGAGFVLDKVFTNLQLDFTTFEDEKKYKKYESNYLVRQFAKFGFFSDFKVEDMRLSRSVYHPKILNLQNAYLDGYWQSVKYFEDILPILKKEFSFKNCAEEKNHAILNRIINEQSVSIHVRRGDYLKTNDYEVLGKDYYVRAISIINNKINNPVFYVFSDDIQWCKKNLGIDAIYVDWNTGSNSCLDMFLMSYCKSNIVANSTFSIWGALLNQNEDNLVICPCKYFQNKKAKKYFWPDKWHKIEF